MYFDCGAKVDEVDVQGLVLSPGFPYNYSSGTHCLWVFFVPAGHQLTMEMFDFDIFESRAGAGRLPALEEEEENLGHSLLSGAGPGAKEPQALQNQEVKQVVVQVESNKMEMAKVSNAAKRSSEAPPDPPPPQLPSGPQPPGDKSQNAVSPQSSESSGEPKGVEVHPAAPTAVGREETLSPETQQPVADVCPHDVLYISDLMRFSSRFCGSNRPSSGQLVFGSDSKRVEVIMELITTTHQGRGFALLFRYHNQTRQPTTGGQRALGPPGGALEVLPAVVCGAAFFAMVLASTLCIILR